MTESLTLENQELMVSSPHRAHKYTASKNHQLSTGSYNFSKGQIMIDSQSLKTGIDV